MRGGQSMALCSCCLCNGCDGVRHCRGRNREQEKHAAGRGAAAPACLPALASPAPHRLGQVRILEDRGGVVLHGLEEVHVKSAKDIFQLLDQVGPGRGQGLLSGGSQQGGPAESQQDVVRADFAQVVG